MEDVVTCFRPGVHGLVPDAWILAPTHDRRAPPVVAIHGITRNLEEMVSSLTPRVAATGRTVVVPHFPRSQFKRYQLAHCQQRADLALMRLMQDLRREQVIEEGPFDLSGFSGGGQFAHRFAWLYPHLVSNLCIAAPGWWTFPDPQVPWPYGIGPEQESSKTNVQNFRLTMNLRRFLGRQIAVCVGVEDIEHDANLRRSAEIDRQQGRNRVQRARNWFEAAKAAAFAQNVPCKISFKLLPGCGHNFANCVENGRLDQVFVSPANPDQNTFHRRSGTDTPTLKLMKRTAA